MKKVLKGLLICAVLVLMACASNDNNGKINASVKDVFTKMTSKVALPCGMMQMDATALENEFGFTGETVEEFVYAKGEDVLLAETIILIKLKDGADTGKVKTKLETYAKEQTEIFNGYVPEQGKVAEKTVVAVKGNVVYLLMSSKVTDLKKVAEEEIK